MTKVRFKHWHILVILTLTALVVWPLFLPGFFSHHDDMQVMRIFQMRKCLQDLQIPCRWVPDLGFGNGYPLFNYYNPFPYYIGGFLSFFVGYISAAKILFFIPLVLGGVSMFFLAKEIYGRDVGILASILYLFAPYRALDSYVRGAVAESFAIALIPLVLYFIYKLTKENNKKNLILFAVSLAAFLTSHTIMTILFLPVLVFMTIYYLWIEKFKSIKTIFLGFLLGIGLAAFFIIPAYFEQNLVQIDNLTKFDLDFRAHFVTLPQLFLDRSWGYGASALGPLDTISFQIGWPHWILVLASIPFVLILKRKNIKLLIFYLGILLIFSLSVLMTHNKSVFIWEKIGVLRFTQFPWRFLAVVIFTASLLVGFFVFSLPGFLKKFLIVVIVLITVVLNWTYFKPQQFIFNLNDKEKLSGKLWETQQKAAILDYLPVGAVEPLEPAPSKPILVEGSAEIRNFKNKSNNWSFEATVADLSKIEMPVFDFPSWQVFVNGQKIIHSNKNYLGRISLTLNPGNYLVVGKLENTKIRTLSNIISAVSILVTILIIYNGKIRKADK